MSLGVGNVALASGSSDMLRESLLDDVGMASVSLSTPPPDGSTSSGEISKPVSLSPQGQKKKFRYDNNLYNTYYCELLSSVFRASYLRHRPG